MSNVKLVRIVDRRGFMSLKKCQYRLNVFIITLMLNCIAPFAFANPVNPEDPYESFNRVMFKFNDVIDTVVLRPLAGLYIKIMPKPFAKGLSNFYANVDNIPTVINDVLQGNLHQAINDTGRFAINSTVGILGLFDVASHFGLEPNAEDFGLTLASWGYKKSSYLVMPFLGPSTLRDTVGFPITYYYMSAYPYIHPKSAEYAWYFGGVVVRRADLLQADGFMKQAAIDKYVFIRDAYLQRRNFLIERNRQSLHLSAPKDMETAKEEVKVQTETRPFVSS